MAKWIGVEKICSCQFVAGLAPAGSSFSPVWDVTETGSRKGTFSEGCDTGVLHGSSVPPIFPVVR